MKTDIIHNQDCLIGMKELPENSIDLIVTDPPYGYSFMGKDWDKVVMGVPYWKECLRVLKHGAFAFVMSAPRQDVLSRAIFNLSEAGFNTGFTSIFWTYASGFPKAGNIGKMVDKRLGVKREVVGKKRSPYTQTGRKESVDYGKYNEQTGEDGYRITEITYPTTPQAKQLDGSYAGFQPKPAVEIIIVAMKPLSEKTYVDQALKNKKGVTWLDDCRVPYDGESPKGSGKSGNSIYEQIKTSKGNDGNITPEKGRFPANLLVSDDVLNDGKIRKGGGGLKHNKNKFFIGIDQLKLTQPLDSGSFSRYFDLDKWAQKTFPFLIVPKASKSEKNKGLTNYQEHKKLSKVIDSNNPNLKGRKANPINQITHDVKNLNRHPTVKPIKLMSYLITLGSRKGDIVLDPFIGSGTTAIAARMLNRKYIGFELNEEYCKIAEARIGSLPLSLTNFT